MVYSKLSVRRNANKNDVEREVGDGGLDQCCDDRIVFWEAEFTVSHLTEVHSEWDVTWTLWWSNKVCEQVTTTADERPGH